MSISRSAGFVEYQLPEEYLGFVQYQCLSLLANCHFVLQEPPFRHAGMLQHDLDGNLQFLHRTWTAKFDPTAEGHWKEVDFITNPLTVEQVPVYSEDYGLFPHQVTTDFEKYCCPNGTDTSGASQCDIKHCISPGNPLPLLTIAASKLDPGVRTVLTSLDVLFTSLRTNQSIASI